MEIRDYFRILRRRGWIILLVAALTTAAALGVSKLQTPIFKAGIKLTFNIDQPVVRIICEAIGQASCAHRGKNSVKGKSAIPTIVMIPPTSIVFRRPNRLPNAPLGRPIAI